MTTSKPKNTTDDIRINRQKNKSNASKNTASKSSAARKSSTAPKSSASNTTRGNGSSSKGSSSKSFKTKRRYYYKETLFPEFKTFKVEEEYEFIKVIGKGAYGEVSLVKQKKNGYTYVCKKISKLKMKKQDVYNIQNEVKFQKLFHSYHVLSFLDGYEFGPNIFLINPRCYRTMGDIFTKYDAMEETTVSHHVHKILEALKVMHDMGVIHFDLKPENIGFLDEDQTKICILDLGISEKVDEKTNSIKSRGGTPGYMSPEAIRKKQCTFATDIFSIGVIVYECIFGICPFDGSMSTYPKSTLKNTLRGLTDQHFKGPSHGVWHSRDGKAKASETVKDFIKICLSLDAESRPTIDAALKHPFMIYDSKLVSRNTLNLAEIIPYKFEDQPKEKSIDSKSDLLLLEELNETVNIELIEVKKSPAARRTTVRINLEELDVIDLELTQSIE